MPSQRLIHTAAQLTTNPRTLTPMPKARRVLMVRPTHFNVDTPINPHMRKADGSLHTLDRARALTQWEALKRAYESLGFAPTVLEGGEGLPDMVFCANQCLPTLTRTGVPRALLSNMADTIRHREVPLVASALAREGYETQPLGERTPKTLFEGMGDCLWLPGRRFLLGGFGSRTAATMYERVAEAAEADVAVFELTNPRFYHLDTCLAILDDSTALACPDAFSSAGWALLNAIFPRVIETSLEEADSPRFACNAHCPDEKHVLIHPGSTRTETQLRSAGFVPVPVDTEEFIKSGGSVFCMKLMFF
ncbi:MAG: amidinotransferase [Silvanigrellales bacterium]|nr:amidinotransferase [Silvanigrellales bacterium]